ncbi:ATP-binding protein [Terriglobus sp. RCC_193]|uniref:ATP-binding protein n=1 Tax=Terriglobus sp. RCC_193 TaxID=3239218 RepID=UPI003525CF2F
MPITAAQIDNWRRERKEHQQLEFKAASRQYDTRKLCAYCVALANEGGGHLILGIADSLPHDVVGSEAFPDINDIAQNLLRWLNFRVNVEAVHHPDGRVIVFSIPSRPRGTAYHYDGRYLMRSGEELVAMSEDRLRVIFDEGRPDWLAQVCREGLSGTEVVELLDTQTFFELRKLPYPTDQAGVLERLRNERLILQRGGGFAILRYGALLLAKRLADFEDLAGKAPRVIVYRGSSKLSTRLEQTGGKGYAVGFEALVQFVMTQLPRNELIGLALREEFELVPSIVIRELVANALVHQDFSLFGASVMIEIYDDRVEISNPGEPIIPSVRFIDGSRSRNETFALIARKLRMCEEKGSGIDKVVNSIEAYQLPAPDFTSTFGRTVAIVYGQRSFDRMSRADRLRACYQHATLRYVMHGEKMSNRSLRERFGLPEDKAAVVSQLIAAALQEGLVKADETTGDSKRFARYVPFWA